MNSIFAYWRVWKFCHFLMFKARRLEGIISIDREALQVYVYVLNQPHRLDKVGPLGKATLLHVDFTQPNSEADFWRLMRRIQAGAFE